MVVLVLRNASGPAAAVTVVDFVQLSLYLFLLDSRLRCLDVFGTTS